MRRIVGFIVFIRKLLRRLSILRPSCPHAIAGRITGMAIALAIFGVAFAAICMWLDVRVASRRKPWARRTAMALLALLAVTDPLGHGVAPSLTATRADDENAAQSANQVPEDSTSDDDTKRQRAEIFEAMRNRASQVTVRIAEQQSEAELIAAPLLRYADQPRLKFDSTLWGWVADGRLLAVCKIEHLDREATWSTCFVSLASWRIDANWVGGRNWSARQPGIEMRSVDKAPATAGDRISRLREMKEIAARFKGTIIKAGINREEMRMLPRPIIRYEKPTGNLLDGAAFALTSNGTNPCTILVLELQGVEGGGEGVVPEWKFAVAGTGASEMSVRLDDQEVWSKARVAPGSYATWFWFTERE